VSTKRGEDQIDPFQPLESSRISDGTNSVNSHSPDSA